MDIYGSAQKKSASTESFSDFGQNVDGPYLAISFFLGPRLFFEFGETGFGFLNLGNLRIGVFPETEELLIMV